MEGKYNPAEEEKYDNSLPMAAFEVDTDERLVWSGGETQDTFKYHLVWLGHYGYPWDVIQKIGRKGEEAVVKEE